MLRRSRSPDRSGRQANHSPTRLPSHLNLDVAVVGVAAQPIGLVLLDAATGASVAPVAADGTTSVAGGSFGSEGFTATYEGAVPDEGKVAFALTGPTSQVRLDIAAPFTLFRESNGALLGNEPTAGSYELITIVIVHTDGRYRLVDRVDTTFSIV